MKASVEVDGAGVDAGAGCTGAGCTGALGAVAGADDVALVFVTCTVAVLSALGTLANTLVVVLPCLSCMSSCSYSTTD